VRGKHLDELRWIDLVCIGFSKANTAPFTYLYLRYCWQSASIPWRLDEVTLGNTVVALPLLFVAFDSTYSLLHWVLHWNVLYKYIHKHHHTQKAPSRANVDAVNVHPIEFVLGEYNHLLTIAFYSSCVGPLHAVTTVLFLAVGGALAGINHTRFDVVIRLPAVLGGLTLYDSKAHDVHHRIPQSNYGQYTMFWDHVFRSYRPYNPEDRVNPDAQLDPTTGKALGVVGVAMSKGKIQ
jgi:sterol desaturase/sphingolipid hydroxylase (fatty acid hydroxylase superfamily)